MRKYCLFLLQMNQDGTVNEEVSRKRAPAHITKEQIDDVINKCKDTSKPTTIDYGLMFPIKIFPNRIEIKLVTVMN